MQWWLQTLGLARNEEHWTTFANKVTWHESSDDWTAANLPTHSRGQSLLLGELSLGILAHGNVFSFRKGSDKLKFVTASQSSKRAGPLMLHANTKRSTLAMLEWLNASRPSARTVTLVSRDDLDQPSDEALGVWRAVVRRWARFGSPRPQWLIQNSLALNAAPGMSSANIGLTQANALSAYLNVSGGREAQTAHRKNLLMCHGMQTRLASRKHALRALRANGFECAWPEASRSAIGERAAALLAAARRNGSSASAYDRAWPYYDAMLHARFVASPIGYGRDCYRTWEALALGAIPVMTEPAELGAGAERDLKFARLPIVWVQRWEDVTPALLRVRWKELMERAREFDLASVFLPSWIATVAGRATRHP